MTETLWITLGFVAQFFFHADFSFSGSPVRKPKKVLFQICSGISVLPGPDYYLFTRFIAGILFLLSVNPQE
jgi:hypothetical protein